MNFLAHSVLSPKDDRILLGNFAGDFFKGTKFDQYHPAIAEGVRLHRKIDAFTDNHQVVKSAKAIIREDLRLFSGVAIDMYWDYFLANNWEKRDSAAFENHIQFVYELSNNHLAESSALFQSVFPIMESNNWLQKYASYDGLEIIMMQMHRRIGERSTLDQSITVLQRHEKQLQELFAAFWMDVLAFVRQDYEIINPIVLNTT
jgi:acyl carrier protein phosphodiesterase